MKSADNLFDKHRRSIALEKASKHREVSSIMSDQNTSDQTAQPDGKIDTEAQLESVLALVRDAIITIDELGEIASFNRAAERLFLYLEADVIGKNVRMLMPAPYREEHDGYLTHYRTTGERNIIGVGREVVAQRKDGSVFPISLSVNEMLSEGKRMFTGVIHDISELQKAQNHINLLGEILDRSLSEIYVFDAQTLHFVQINHGAMQNMGYSEEELAQLTIFDINTELTKYEIDDLIARLWDGAEELITIETRHHRKDGSSYPVETQLQLMRNETPPVIAAIAQDITQRKKHQEDLQLRDRAINSVDVGVLITSATKDENRIVYANKAIEIMTGYSAAEMMGRNPRFLQGNDRDQPERKLIRDAMAAKEPVQVIVRNYRKDGTLFIEELTISPVRDESGEVTHMIGVQRDVTAKLDVEERLRQSQKMEAVGQLTGGIAHDFNNLLTIIIGNQELLADWLADDAFAKSLLADTLEAAESGAKLTGQLLSFSRQQSLKPKSIDLNRFILDISDMLYRYLGETIKFGSKLAPDLGMALADTAQLHNALLNLSINARDAMPDGGHLTIETSNVVFDADAARERTEVQPGEYVRVSVSDTGMGMSAEVRERVLEPFFTTKEQGKGTGLGLSMVHGFAKQSGGHLEIFSELGIGTTMSLYLPIASQSTEVETKGDVLTSPAQVSGETVLVVEDDPRVRKITVNRLEHLGYKVIEAETGQAALDILAQFAAIDVVFTDMVMPGGMNGTDLLEKVREMYPDIKRLVTSGYAEGGVMPSDVTMWLHKPYSLQEMSKTFRQLLD
jgi:two-component system cell cycle sensor histidine kinase/response regulator CckA